MKYRINFNLFLFFLLIGIIIFSLFYGAVRVPISDVIKILLNKYLEIKTQISKKGGKWKKYKKWGENLLVLDF